MSPNFQELKNYDVALQAKQSIMIYRILIFLIANFSALAIGGLFTGKGVSSNWYQDLTKAPWTPPGWVFGAAWTLIMICLTIYMANAYNKIENKTMFTGLYVVQLVLNILWNPVFFHYKATLTALLAISLLTLLVGFLLLYYWNEVKSLSLLLAPYLIWLIIATSLNAYIVLNNS